MLKDILNVSIYSIIGIVLMLLGSFMVDLVIPCSFPEEIKKGNKSVAWVSAGAFVAIGTIIKAAVASPLVLAEAVEESLGTGILSTVFYFAIGTVFLMIGYILIKAFNRQYNLNEEIGKGNEAAGIIVFGASSSAEL